MAVIESIKQRKRPIIAIALVPENVSVTWIRGKKVVAIDDKEKMPSQSEYGQWLDNMDKYIIALGGKYLNALSYRQFCFELAHNKKACILIFKVKRTVYRVFAN